MGVINEALAANATANTNGLDSKPNCVEKSQIYESESEMEEFPHDYFWVSLKNF